MEHRPLGRSGFKVPVLSLGTATFEGGTGALGPWCSSDVRQATRLVDICLDAGLTMFDTADVYSGGRAEEVLGQAIAGRRNRVIISTKASLRSGKGPDDVGSTRNHLLDAVNGSLRRLRTDYIDLFQLHTFDSVTPIIEVLQTLNELVQAGKIRHVGVSNFSGWQLMKSLAIAEKHGLPRYVAHQTYYSLVGREYEWELMPLGLDQHVSAVVWSPLGWGRLTGQIRRGQRLPDESRLHKPQDYGPTVPEDYLYRVTDALQNVAEETGKSVAQVALNWLLQRPTIASVIIGVRNEEQLQQNLRAVGWALNGDHMRRLDEASATPLVYPYWLQRCFPELNPPPV